MLNGKVDEFRVPEQPDDYHFPDRVVEAFLKIAPKNLFDIDPAISGPDFSYIQSRDLILEAFHDFHPTLAQKAEKLFAQGFEEAAERNFIEANGEPLEAGPSRWRLKKVEAGQARHQCSVSSKEDINPNDYAVIQLEFDGKISSVIYMAHEMGHAIADDYQSKNGLTNWSNPQHLQETQAYLTQHILYDYLNNHPDDEIRAASQNYFTFEMGKYINGLSKPDYRHERPMSILSALGIYTKIKDERSETRIQTAEMLWGNQGIRNINEVLARCGVERTEDINLLAAKTMNVSMAYISGRNNSIALESFPDKTYG